MCLSTLKEITITEGVGYKCFIANRERKVVTTTYESAKLETGKWIEDIKDGEIKEVEGSAYRTGFHIWATKEGAIHDSEFGCEDVRTVEFKDVVAQGYQWGHEVIVARQIRIGKVVKLGIS